MEPVSKVRVFLAKPLGEEANTSTLVLFNPLATVIVPEIVLATALLKAKFLVKLVAETVKGWGAELKATLIASVGFNPII